MLYSKKLLIKPYELPVILTPPTEFTTELLVDITGVATSRTGTIDENGWYRVRVGAADSEGTYHGGGSGVAGYAEKIFYAYTGSKYLIWSSSGLNTGYPWPKGNGGVAGSYPLGGGGKRYVGFNYSDAGTKGYFESGGGGGSPTGNGGPGVDKSGHDEHGASGGADGGGGAGFICGIDAGEVLSESFADGTFSVDSVITMVLAGGAGGQASDEGSYRSGGGGGGAWGNGGECYTRGSWWDPSQWQHSAGTYIQSYNGGTGPGGSQGQGGYGNRYGPSGDGAWAIRDFSTDTFSYGLGGNGRPRASYCTLEKLILS